MITRFILSLRTIIHVVTIISPTDAFLSFHIFRSKRCFKVVLYARGQSDSIPFGPFSNLSRLPLIHFTLPRLVQDMRRHTPPRSWWVSSQSVSLHSFVLFLLTVFPPLFFSFPPTVHAAKLKWHHAEGKSELNTYPQGPEGETGTNGGRGICSTVGWDVYQEGGKSNITSGNSLCRWTSVQQHVDWNVENIRSVLTWWWGGVEDRQMGWEGFDERGSGEEAINKSRWKKGGT